MKENAIQEVGRREVELREILNSYLRLGEKLENPPRIELVAKTSVMDDSDGQVGARDIAVSTAFQCYSSGTSKITQRRDEKSEMTAESTLNAGHLTTRMHSFYMWQMTGVTRSVVHDVFHSHPFYNSSQQSQRYVEAKRGNFLVPDELTPEQKNFYIEAAEFSNEAYFEMLDKLKPVVSEKVHSVYPEDGWRSEKTKGRLEGKIQKLSQEIARYVLPIAQHTNLDYSLSEIQLIRLFLSSKNQNFTDEARFIIGSMIDEVAKKDPTILRELRTPLDSGMIRKFDEESVSERNREIDKRLNSGGKNSSMYKPSEDISSQLINSVTGIVGDINADNDLVLKSLLDPKENALLADVYGAGIFDPLTNTLNQVSLSFLTRISHTGDSQRQRQRMTGGATPPLESLYSGKTDYMTPLVVRGNPELDFFYNDVVNKEFENVKKALEMGIPKEYALLLLPNALTIRLVETGTLYNWLVRWKERLCHLAQEEIFFVSVEQVEQLLEYLPQAKNALLAKCGIRNKAGIGHCPEGDRWCGQGVFNWPIEEYKKNRLI